MINEANPVFVKIDTYKEILDVVDVINKKIVNVKQLIAQLDDLKNKEEAEIMSWEKNMEEITHKIESLKEELSGDR